MNERKPKRILLLCAVPALAAAAALLLFCKFAPFRAYTLRLPQAQAVAEITLSDAARERRLSDASAIAEALALLTGGGRSSHSESIQDAPVDAQQVICVELHHASGGASVLFAYEKRGKYWLEQPYNGIYPFEEAEWQSLTALLAA